MAWWLHGRVAARKKECAELQVADCSMQYLVATIELQGCRRGGWWGPHSIFIQGDVGAGAALPCRLTAEERRRNVPGDMLVFVVCSWQGGGWSTARPTLPKHFSDIAHAPKYLPPCPRAGPPAAGRQRLCAGPGA